MTVHVTASATYHVESVDDYFFVDQGSRFMIYKRNTLHICVCPNGHHHDDDDDDFESQIP